METAKVAYFSMEIALDAAIPTYSGGLGVLAGDTLRAAADLELPLAAVSLLYRKGYFEQHLDERGNQVEKDVSWRPEEVLQPTEAGAIVAIEGREVRIRAWRHLVTGASGHHVPVYLLDTNLQENSPQDRSLTDHLYGGDEHYRICQEVVLGIGGVRMLQALGYRELQSYHMNEGHSSFLALALLEQQLGKPDLRSASEADIEAVREKCVFTTHTPVPAGHDQFPRSLMRQVLGEALAGVLEVTRCCPDNVLNMTYLALRFSRYINGVAMHHGEISHDMFPNYPVRAITNGVHAFTWTSPPFRELYDRHIPEWRHDNQYLRYVIGIPLDEIIKAHQESKKILLDAIQKEIGTKLDESLMTIGFARRAATYKRADLIFSNLDRLKWIANRVGRFQLIFAGKAHPRDEGGRELIRRIFEAGSSLRGTIEVIYVPDYDMRWGQLITSGVDLWLNTPHRPYEASGTSGMKAALNGVPSLSVPDGWWYEGHFEGITGWDIGHEELLDDPAAEAASLYDKLELVILPMFYARPNSFAEIMRSTIALNGSFFNAQRMLSQYMLNAYSLEERKRRNLNGTPLPESRPDRAAAG